MSRSNYVEVICDGCGCAEHFRRGITNKELSKFWGWVVEGRKHYCTEECKDKDNA